MHYRVSHARVSPILHSALALAMLLSMLLVPVGASPVLQEAAPEAVCIALTGLHLTGPAYGEMGTQLIFTTQATNADASLPVYFQWVVTDYVLPLPSESSGTKPVSTMEFGWSEPGIKTITVTASNCQSAYGYPQTLEITIGPLPLTEVPDDIRQRAALHLEEQRASGQAPEWQYAYLSDNVRPLYRPDMDPPAYYEFAVMAPPSGGGAGAAAVLPDEPAGFIVVSTGAHDYPVPHWATMGLPPTERMRQEALLNQQPAPVRFFRLDALSYVAEDAQGEMVARDGNTPQRITGIPNEWLTNPPPIVETIAQPGAMFPLEPSGTPVTYTVSVVNELDPNPVAFAGWDSWEAFKSGFAGHYAPYLQAQRNSAALEWETEQHAREWGYVLYKGQSLSYPLLWADPVPVYDGLAWAEGLVTAAIETPPGELPRLVVTAVESLPGQSAQLTATIGYGNGMTDTLKVMVVYRGYVYLPAVTTGTVEGVTPASSPSDASAFYASAPNAFASDVDAQAGVAGTLAADGYTYWYASAASAATAGAQQPWYGQYTAEDLIGNCKSGCGPTAWAMLIAWGDRNAHDQTLPGSEIWAGRIGLYRNLGGRGDPEVVAPQFMGDQAQAAGVKAMTFELNQQVGTFCNAFNDSGATVPATMGGVVGYLNGRSGMQVKTWYNPAGFDLAGYSAQSIGEKARNVIQNPMSSRRPSIIGIGLLSHYPLAFGYREKPLERCSTQCVWVPGGSFFGTCTTTCSQVGTARGWYVNQGNASPGYYGTSEWVASDLFFAGRLTPHTSFANDVGLYRASNNYFFLDYESDAAHDRSIAPFGWPEGIRPAMGDFDRDGMLDDIAAYIWSTDVASWKRGWRIDYSADRSTDVFLNRWTAIDDAWPVGLDADRDGFVDDLGMYWPALRGWGWNINALTRSNPSGTCYYDTYPGFPVDGRPVTGDFNRDGYHDDVAVFSPLTGMWYFDHRSNGCGIDRVSGQFGMLYDLPVSGDFDKDGFVDDVAVYSSLFLSGTSYGDRYWRYDYDANNTGMAVDKTSPLKYGSFGDMPFAGNFDTR